MTAWAADPARHPPALLGRDTEMTHRHRRQRSDDAEICPRCKREVDPQTVDCPHCGQTINDAEAILG